MTHSEVFKPAHFNPGMHFFSSGLCDLYQDSPPQNTIHVVQGVSSSESSCIVSFSWDAGPAIPAGLDRLERLVLECDLSTLPNNAIGDVQEPVQDDTWKQREFKIQNEVTIEGVQTYRTEPGR